MDVESEIKMELHDGGPGYDERLGWWMVSCRGLKLLNFVVGVVLARAMKFGRQFDFDFDSG